MLHDYNQAQKFLVQAKTLQENSSYLSANCNFEEESFCQWHQVNDGSDDFDWSIGRGETASKKTGPIVDHTTRSKEGN